MKPGLIALSQQILGPNTLVQGALPAILANTPSSFFENTMQVIQVSTKVHILTQCKSGRLYPEPSRGGTLNFKWQARDDQKGKKLKPPKNPLGFNQDPKKSLDQNIITHA